VDFVVRRSDGEVSLRATLAERPAELATDEPGWLQERIDLSEYVGGEVLIRFEYVTDQAALAPGWVIDDISIPEIGYFDEAEEDDGWVSAGWLRMDNTLPQGWLVQLVVLEGRDMAVTRLLSPGDAPNGQWDVRLGGGRRVILVISPLAPVTTEPAAFDLAVEPAG
jgi:hypothetical protein